MKRRSLLLAPLAGALHAEPRATLTIATFPLLDEITAAAIPQWQRLHPDVALRLINRQYADHHTAMTTALSTATQLPDVMALESSFVGRFSRGTGLDDLTREPYLADRHRARLVPYAYDQALGVGGALVALPADIGPGTMLYRQDITSRAGVAEQDLTLSWDSYIEAGRRIKAATGTRLIADAQQIKDMLLRTGLKPGQGMYYDSEDRALADSERFERAFALALRARQLGIDARVKTWTSDWAERLQRGGLATELGGAWLVGQFSNWVAPGTRGLWRAASLPEGANAGYGGAFWAIPRKSDPARKQAAWDFIRLMCLDPARQLAAFKTHDAFPALLETHDAAFFEEPVDFLGGQRARLLWRDAARRIRANPVHKQNAFAEEVVATELDKVLTQGKRIREALADAQTLLQRRARR